MTPKKIFFTKGVGMYKEKLASYEMALRDAGIAPFNLIAVSSILPPSCIRIPREEGISLLNKDFGRYVHLVISRNETNEPSRLIASAIGCAIPQDPNQYGYISEHKSFGETDEIAGEYAEDLAASMLASTLGIEFDIEKAWNEREEIFKMSEKIVKTFHTVQSARGNKDGLWTATIAAAVFIDE